MKLASSLAVLCQATDGNFEIIPQDFQRTFHYFDILIGAIQMCCNIVTIYYVIDTTYINQQLLKVKILATYLSYSEPPSDNSTSIKAFEQTTH